VARSLSGRSAAQRTFDRYPAKASMPARTFFVGELDGSIVGTILSGYDGHRGWLYSVAVSPRQHRQGLGSKLVRHAETSLIALGCTKINLQVRATNAAVTAFYAELGYEVEERISMGKRFAHNKV
jgi:ribosomal protein S18 acetylase RimI-like enzyme